MSEQTSENTNQPTTYLGRTGPTAPTPAGPQPIGVTAAEREAAFELARATLAEFLPIEVTRNFAGAQWTKLIVNQINALPAITGLPVQETIAHPGLRRVLTASMAEAVGVARSRGVHFEPLLGLSDPLLTVFSHAPAPLAGLLPRLMARRMGSTPNPGSTLQSIRRGQLTEIDHLNGAVVAEARAAQAADAAHAAAGAPVNAALVALVHRVEAEHAFLTPAEVVRAVPLTR